MWRPLFAKIEMKWGKKRKNGRQSDRRAANVRLNCSEYSLTNGPSTYFPIWWLRVVYVHVKFISAMAKKPHQLNNALPTAFKCWQSNECSTTFEWFSHDCYASEWVNSMVFIVRYVCEKMVFGKCEIPCKSVASNEWVERIHLDFYSCFETRCAVCLYASCFLLLCITCCLPIYRSVYIVNRNYRNVDYIHCRIAHWIRIWRMLETNTYGSCIKYIIEMRMKERMLWAVQFGKLSAIDRVTEWDRGLNSVNKSLSNFPAAHTLYLPTLST